MLTLEKIKLSDQEISFLVIQNGQKLGYVKRFKKQKGYNFPWQGFKLDGGMSKPNTLTGSFYGSGAKEKAIKSVVK